MWGVLPLSYHCNPNNHRWSLGSYDIVFKNKSGSPHLHLLQAKLTISQSLFLLLHPRPNPPYASSPPLASRRPLPAYHVPSCASFVPSPLPSGRFAFTGQSLYTISGHLRSLLFAQRRLHIHNRWQRHVPRALSIRHSTILLGPHLSRRSRASTSTKSHALFSMGNCKTDIRAGDMSRYCADVARGQQ